MTAAPTPDDQRIHSPDELRAMIAGMEEASAVFYSMAQKVGNHAFIEHTGLMNEYIKLCKAAVDQGIDFTCANTHLGQELSFGEHNLVYIMEKLDCIYGPTIAGHLKSRLSPDSIANEREQCARIADAVADRIEAAASAAHDGDDAHDPNMEVYEELEMQAVVAGEIAETIRAR